MEIQKSKVYILLDERNRVLRCEGGYTMSNIDDVSLTLEKPLTRLPRAWVEGLAACKRLEPVGVIACKHIWADIVRDPMVRPCVKCGKEGGLRKWMISASDLQMHSCKKVEYSPRVRIRLPSK